MNGVITGKYNTESPNFCESAGELLSLKVVHQQIRDQAFRRYNTLKADYDGVETTAAGEWAAFRDEQWRVGTAARSRGGEALGEKVNLFNSNRSFSS